MSSYCEQSTAVSIDELVDFIPDPLPPLDEDLPSPPDYFHHHDHPNHSSFHSHHHQERSASAKHHPYQHNYSSGTMRSPQTWAVISQAGFQQSELLTILSHLTKVEIGLSILFMIHGVSCPGYASSSVYKSVCHTNVVSSMAGIFTGVLGIAALSRYRWKGLMVACLIMAVIAATGCLIVVVCAAVWLDHLTKIDAESGFFRGMSVMLLLMSVAAGVCYILTATFICHHWSSRSMKYQVVGRLASKTRPGGSRCSESPLLSEKNPQMEMQTLQYHVCTPRCSH